jgi:hypothetical protein
MMSGRISADVQANLSRSGAFKALNGGFGGDSSMGRNLQARDLGLTSLDLMTKGDQMARDWRKLNYDTRVDGLQVDPYKVMQNNGLSSQQALDAANNNATRQQQSNIAGADIRSAGATNNFNAQNNALTTNYGNNYNAIESESTGRLKTYDDIYSTNNKAADTVRGQKITLGQNLYNTNLGILGNSMNVGLANVNSISDSNRSLANTVFNSTVGVGEKLYNTNTAGITSTYGTGINTAGMIYQGNLGIGGNIFTGRTGASTNAATMQTNAEIAKFNALAAASGQVAGTSAGVQQQQMLNSQATSAAQNQMFGTLFNSAASVAGSYIGSQNWNSGSARGGFSSLGTMQNNTIPGTTGSYVSGAGWVPKATAA